MVHNKRPKCGPGLLQRLVRPGRSQIKATPPVVQDLSRQLRHLYHAAEGGFGSSLQVDLKTGDVEVTAQRARERAFVLLRVAHRPVAGVGRLKMLRPVRQVGANLQQRVQPALGPLGSGVVRIHPVEHVLGGHEEVESRISVQRFGFEPLQVMLQFAEEVRGRLQFEESCKAHS